MISDQSIAQRAYELWEARGRPHGSAQDDWLEAQRQLAQPAGERAIDSSLKESFPASDPPASHLPDVPPANASDKWNAARAASASGKRGARK